MKKIDFTFFSLFYGISKKHYSSFSSRIKDYAELVKLFIVSKCGKERKGFTLMSEEKHQHQQEFLTFFFLWGRSSFMSSAPHLDSLTTYHDKSWGSENQVKVVNNPKKMFKNKWHHLRTSWALKALFFGNQQKRRKSILKLYSSLRRNESWNLIKKHRVNGKLDSFGWERKSQIGMINPFVHQLRFVNFSSS